MCWNMCCWLVNNDRIPEFQCWWKAILPLITSCDAYYSDTVTCWSTLDYLLQVDSQMDIWWSRFNVRAITPLIPASHFHLFLLSTGIWATAFSLHLSLLFHFLLVIPEICITDLFILTSSVKVSTSFLCLNKHDGLVWLYLFYGILTGVTVFHVGTLISTDGGVLLERKTVHCCISRLFLLYVLVE